MQKDFCPQRTRKRTIFSAEKIGTNVLLKMPLKRAILTLKMSEYDTKKYFYFYLICDIIKYAGCTGIFFITVRQFIENQNPCDISHTIQGSNNFGEIYYQGRTPS